MLAAGNRGFIASSNCLTTPCGPGLDVRRSRIRSMLPQTPPMDQATHNACLDPRN